jgi:hypothetical protein
MTRALTSATVVATLALAVVGGRAEAGSAPVIDADVQALTEGGTARVLVDLRVPGSDRAEITRVQDQILAHLSGTKVRVARRYETVPLLALEIDAAALERLKHMGALVVRVRVDALSDPTVGPPR